MQQIHQRRWYPKLQSKLLQSNKDNVDCSSSTKKNTPFYYSYSNTIRDIVFFCYEVSVEKWDQRDIRYIVTTIDLGKQGESINDSLLICLGNQHNIKEN